MPPTTRVAAHVTARHKQLHSHGNGVLIRLGRGGTAAAVSAASVHPLYQGSVRPRTSCGGFNGQVKWSNGTIFDNAYIDVWGELWNNKCPGATEYLYVNYTNGGGEYGPNIGKAGYRSSGNTGIDWSTDSVLDYGSISVDVCDNFNRGWHCGTPAIP